MKFRSDLPLPDMLPFILLLLALAGAPAPLRCQTPAQNPPATPDKLSNPDGIVIEKFDTSVRFESNGTGERTRTAVVRVESDAAVRQLGVLAFSFNSSEERLIVDYVRVRKRDGATVETPSSNFQETLSPVTQAAPMYSNVRAMQIPVRSLAVGDTLEYRIGWTLIKPDIPDQFWYAHDFIHDGTVKAETLAIDLPAGKYVKIAGRGGEPKVTEQNSRKLYYWSSAYAASDKAPAAVSRKKTAHSVEITTLKSWEELGRWYAGLAAPKAVVTPAVQAKASELTKGLATAADKERAIYDYVSTRFRYISISLGDARYQPHAAEEVLSNLYGDCKDKDTLLRALLKAAGIDAWPALTGEDLPFDADAPSLAQFNHAITVIPHADGKYIWLDTTPEIAPFGFIQKSLRGQQALVMPTTGAPRLMDTPPNPPMDSKETFQVKATLSPEGTLTGHIEWSVTGDSDLTLRSVFHQLNPTQWEQAMQQMSYSTGFAGKVSAIDISNPQDTSKPFHLAYDYTREKYSDWDNLQIVPPFPLIGLPVADAKPSEPIDLGGTAESFYDATITLPPGYSMEIPGPVRESSDAVDYECSYAVSGSVLIVRRTMKIKKETVPVEAWNEYHRLQTTVNASVGRFVRLSHTGGSTQVSVVEDNPQAATLITTAIDDLRRGDVNGGRDALAEAERLNPKQPGLWVAYATLYATTNNIDRAFESIHKEITNHPDDTRWRRALALFGQNYKRDLEEESGLRELLKIAPGDQDASRRLTAMLIREKRFDEVLQASQKALESSPGDLPLETVRTEALLRSGRKAEGIAMAKEIAAHAPAPEILNDVAWYLADTQADAPLAREYAGRAVAQIEDGLKVVHLSELQQDQLRKILALGNAWDTFAWAAFNAGDYRAAEKFAKAAWKLEQRGILADHLGQIYEKEGRKQDAIAVWKLALAADSHLDAVRDRLKTANPPRVIAKDKKMTTVQIGVQPAPEEQLGRMRTVGLPGPARTKGSAEFFVLLSPKGVEDVEFISGEDALRSAKQALMQARFDQPFPDSGPEKIARRGIVSCSQYTTPNCQFTMLLPSNTTVK